MPSLPATDATIVLRLSFASAAAWSTLASCFEPDGPLADSYVLLVDDRAWRGASLDDVCAKVPDGDALVIFVADEHTLRDPDLPLLVIEPTRNADPFRCPISQFEVVNDNLSLGNLDWEDFLPLLDSEGTFRGFGT